MYFYTYDNFNKDCNIVISPHFFKLGGTKEMEKIDTIVMQLIFISLYFFRDLDISYRCYKFPLLVDFWSMAYFGARLILEHGLF